jgi:hypothetical protein
VGKRLGYHLVETSRLKPSKLSIRAPSRSTLTRPHCKRTDNPRCVSLVQISRYNERWSGTGWNDGNMKLEAKEAALLHRSFQAALPPREATHPSLAPNKRRLRASITLLDPSIAHKVPDSPRLKS